ncbi:hypothetical protein QEZ54_04495 [Catellatospora sp. KI3]|uniref:hypothetical protein n=1 Tax=Catellatospora sp. KI3 TaxID=3041620 RepID=UPI002483159F|nr:hypothetical protein [Catellatospora sp. KI3]MDI1460219.1 hypothetical protein [Catellatospora sp. KI3]
MRAKNVGRWVLSGALALVALSATADVETGDDYQWGADYQWGFVIADEAADAAEPAASIVDPADTTMLRLERDYSWG